MSRTVFTYLLTEVIAASFFSLFFYWVVLNVFRACQNFIQSFRGKEIGQGALTATLVAGINAGVLGIYFGGPEKNTLAPTMANVAFWIVIGLVHGLITRARKKENRGIQAVDVEPEGLSLEEEYRQELLTKAKRKLQ